MADNIIIVDALGTQKEVATDEIGVVHYQRNKIVLGADGVNDGDLSLSNPMPIVDIDPSIYLLRRIAKCLESSAVVDYANRQRVSLDVAPATVTVTGTVVVSQLTNLNGVDPRYQFIDQARMAYSVGIRSQLVVS